MAKNKIQKKKSLNKITIASFEKKLQKNKSKTSKKNEEKKYDKNKKNNIKKIVPKKITKDINKKEKPKSDIKKQKSIIQNKELENKIDIPIITRNKKNESNLINYKEEEIKEKVEEKVKNKLEEKIDQKIKEKLEESNQTSISNLLTTNENGTNESRKIVKKDDVFSKVADWFSNLTNDLNNNIRKRKVTNIEKKPNQKIQKRNKEVEEEPIKTYPKNKFLKALVIFHENLYIPFDTIIVLTYIILIVGMCRVQVIPSSTIKYIAGIVGFLSIVAISLNKYISGRIFTLLITAGMCCGIYYLNYTYDFINNLNTKLYEYQEYYVVSLDNGRNKSIYNINNKKVGIVEENSKNVKHVLNTKLDRVSYVVYKDQEKLYSDFLDNKTRAIIVKENQYKYIQNNNINPGIKVKILYKFNVNTKKQGEQKWK